MWIRRVAVVRLNIGFASAYYDTVTARVLCITLNDSA